MFHFRVGPAAGEVARRRPWVSSGAMWVKSAILAHSASRNTERDLGNVHSVLSERGWGVEVRHGRVRGHTGPQIRWNKERRTHVLGRAISSQGRRCSFAPPASHGGRGRRVHLCHEAHLHHSLHDNNISETNTVLTPWAAQKT